MNEAQAKRARATRPAAPRRPTVPLMLVDPRWNPNEPVLLKKVCWTCESTFTPYVGHIVCQRELCPECREHFI